MEKAAEFGWIARGPKEHSTGGIINYFRWKPIVRGLIRKVINNIEPDLSYHAEL